MSRGRSASASPEGPDDGPLDPPGRAQVRRWFEAARAAGAAWLAVTLDPASGRFGPVSARGADAAAARAELEAAGLAVVDWFDLAGSFERQYESAAPV
jgi:hypothetical protein